jgi:pimeloyl-ACP methyl ester carboxylesterase
MHERFCTIGDIELCFETFGDPADPALLLVMGLGTQMIAWHEEFCAILAGKGFHVIRFDNRDVGRSTILRHLPSPTVAQLARRSRVPAAYGLADMAIDAAGLLDHLEVPAAHVAGASLGGMIAQTFAARLPHRVRSLASIMSTTGSLRVGQPQFRMWPVLLRAAPRERDAFVEHMVAVFRAIGVPDERDEADLRRLAEVSFERGTHASGVGRQMAAALAAGNRTKELRRVTAPTVAIHGALDPLIKPSGGRATARAIPGAQLVVVRDMGHDMPRRSWPRITDAIVANARRGRAPARRPGRARRGSS